MTIDEAIRQLEEMRRLYGGHVPVKFRLATPRRLDDSPSYSDHDLRFEMENWGQLDAIRYAPARVLRVYRDDRS